MALEKDPDKRISVVELLRRSQKELSAFLRHTSKFDLLSPIEEIEQLVNHLPEKKILELMPRTEKQGLKDRLNKLKVATGFSKEQAQMAEQLLKRVV